MVELKKMGAAAVVAVGMMTNPRSPLSLLVLVWWWCE